MQTNFNKIFNNLRGGNNSNEKLKSFLFFLGKDAFLVILFVLLLEVIFAEILFYQYVLSVDIKEPSSSESFVGFKENEYQLILKEWQSREDSLKNYSFDNLSNPFQP